MIKRTLYFGNPYYLSKKLEQLVIQEPATIKELPSAKHTVPIEDIGLVMLDHPQITVSRSLLGALLANNVAVVTCDDRHHPAGLLLPLEGHHTQAVQMRQQIAASEPLKKTTVAADCGRQNQKPSRSIGAIGQTLYTHADLRQKRKKWRP